MTSNARNTPPAMNGDGRFITTRWTMVVRAGTQSSREAESALAMLCETYWYPLYAFVRRQGYNVNDAQDLTQAFFAHLLEKRSLQVANPERGRFRSFLLASMKNFIAKRIRHQAAQKRGGGRVLLSLDFDDGEKRYSLASTHCATPEKIFERQWALTLLDRTLTLLRAEFQSSGKLELFNELKIFVGGDKAKVPYRELAERLGMSEGAVKVATHRLRRRYRELLREEIKQTIGEDEDVDDELGQLFGTLAS